MDPRDAAGKLMQKGYTKSDIEKVWGQLGRSALKYGSKVLPKVKSIASKSLKRVTRYGKKWKKYPAGRKALTAAALGGEAMFAGEMVGAVKGRKKKAKLRAY